MREWHNTFFRRKLFVLHYRKTSRGTLRRFGKALTVTMYYGCEGNVKFFRRNFCVSLHRNILGTLRSFRKLLAAKTFFGCQVDITFLQQKLFCLTIPKNFNANFSLFQKNFLSSKTFHEWVGEVSFSSNIFFVSPYRKNSKGTARCSRKNLVAKIFMDEIMGYHVFFVDTFLSYFIENFPWKLSVVSENFW